MNLSRSISTEMWLARKLCTIVEGATVVEAVTAGNPVRLYQRLSALGATKESLAKTLNQYIMESENEKDDELDMLRLLFIFNSLMSLHMRKQNPEKVDPLVQEMKRNIPLDKRTYKTWMQSYATLEDFEAAELFSKVDEVLKMAEKLVKPLKGREPYHFFISLYACTSNLSGVKRVWKALKKFFPAKNNESYLVMLQALCKLNDIEGLKEMFEEWESVCSKYDMGLANVALRGYLSQGTHEEAELIFANACKKTKGKGSFLEAWEMLMVHALNTLKVDLADNHLRAAVLGWGMASIPRYQNCISQSTFEDKKDVMLLRNFARF
ncbi:hypothetical protein ACFX2J_025536 [Malus domestica]|uniref:Pentacotripeptide-repeat region of PRORP domain-containing protein n=1 Tax=Malus domestica TaxID=3750 RepID=A0A498HAB6_MALDO|nr:hypothetical protein DVH24_030731 [Malus domestica]